MGLEWHHSAIQSAHKLVAAPQRLPDAPALLLPAARPRRQPPERGEVDDHAVVEIRSPQRRHAGQVVAEALQLGDEARLGLNGLALTRRGAGAALGAQPGQAPLLGWDEQSQAGRGR